MVSIQLSDEEKVHVVFVALLLFACACILSVCLAASLCPLNRWLSERHEKRRRRQQREFASRRRNNQSGWSQPAGERKSACRFVPGSLATATTAWNQQHYLSQQHKSASSATLTSYLGPPPAYEAALRATRLQSITSLNCALGASSTSPDWLQSALEGAKNDNASAEPQPLDLGDYFHAPKEFSGPLSVFGAHEQAAQGHVCIPMAAGRAPTATTGPDQSTEAAERRPPPVMLRLWVCLMDPGEVVARAREHLESTAPVDEGAGRDNDSLASSGRRLTRQLSIPHLFGSLMSLAGSKSLSNAEQPQQQADSNTEQPVNSIANELSSLSSQNSSATSSCGGHQLSTGDTDGKPQELQPGVLRGGQAGGAISASATELAASKLVESCRSGQHLRGGEGARLRRSSSVSPITSRVLHMNIAAFSYVKDESLISTKRHNQMNFSHFHTRADTSPATGSQTQQQQQQAAPKSTNKSMCQLLISVCDIENLLNSSWADERACAQLAQSSSIYVQCEILTNKSQVGSTAARLLRNPLKVLQHQTSAGSLQTHTVDFRSELPAAALEQTPATAIASVRKLPESTDSEPDKDSLPAEPLEADCDEAKRQEQQAPSWRHEPQADGIPIVVFQSVPKQLVQPQSHQPVSCCPDANVIDLIQFDSVFVSPILSRTTLEEGCLRFRVYSQCKYVNETCLAELRLPLRQLVRGPARDNLGDASVRPQKQADLILNNLLANLVTASTGSPLSTLIEQISAERDEEREQQAPPSADCAARQSPGAGPLVSMFPWHGGKTAPGGPGLQRSSSSLGVSLFSPHARPAPSQPRPADPDEEAEEAWRAECERRIEQNYCRSLMVSHWLNYLVAPSYACQTVRDTRGRLALGVTYLPTSNRLLFNAHRATIELEALGGRSGNSTSKQLVKKLRLQSDTSYLVRFMMLANGRVAKRKQTGAAPRPEWDSQEAVTFDLVNVSVEQPSFVVALVMRNARVGPALLTGSLQNLRAEANCSRCDLAADQTAPGRSPAGGVQSDPESLRRPRAPLASHTGALCRLGPAEALAADQLGGPAAPRRVAARAAKDLVIGHFVLSGQIWHDLRSQPRRQIFKQFELV